MVKCEICGKEFENDRGLWMHYGISHPETKYERCTECGEYFKNTKEHLREEHNYSAKCNKCDKLFLNREGLKKHIVHVHTKKEKTACPICGEMFEGKIGVSTHIGLTHSNHKKCRVCGRYFQDLETHQIESHDFSEKCHICGMRFEDSWGLVFHYIQKKGHPKEEKPELKEKDIPQMSEERNKKVSEALSGRKRPNHSRIMKNKEKPMLKARKKTNMKPNHLERKVARIFRNNNLPLRYVGDGSLWIDKYNPDFIHKEKDLIVEVFGCYWHGCSEHFPEERELKERSNKRITSLESLGYQILILWEHEIDNLSEEEIVQKVRNFVKN